MRLFHLSLTNFRNYSRLELSLPEGAVLLYGQNAQGKTSLLEAVYYLATSRLPWANSDRQLLNWAAENDPLPFARICAEVGSRRSPLTRIEIILTREPDPDGGIRFKKHIKVNGVARRAMDLLGELNVVVFQPHDLAIVEGSPSERRHYLNVTLAQTDDDYAQALQTYEKALTQRNALLRRIDERQAKPGDLAYWDDQIVLAGSIIIAGRQRLLRELEILAQKVHFDLTGGAETLEVQYRPSFTPTAKLDGQLSFDTFGLDLHRQLRPDEIALQFRAALKEHQREEIQRGITLVGPQRDELRFTVNGHDLGMFGSRGQARTAVMALKLAELGWMREVIGEWPILLLDEFIAELDAARRAYLLNKIDGASQSILTTTEPDIFTEDFLHKAAVWKVHAGQINTNPGNTSASDTAGG